jgi:hypothetical protein
MIIEDLEKSQLLRFSLLMSGALWSCCQDEGCLTVGAQKWCIQRPTGD